MATEDKEKNPLAIDSRGESSFLGKVFKNNKPGHMLGVIFLAVILIIGAVFVGLKVSDNISGEKELQDIVIGDITITPEDVNNYTIALNESLGEGSYDESTETVALNELVLNAALMKEAKDASVELTDEQIVTDSADPDQTKEDIEASVGTFREQSKVDITRAENEAYKNALEDVLLSKKNLLLVESNFDTPYYKSITADEANAEYEKIKNRLNNELLPLVKSGASQEEISKKVDVDFINNNKTSDEIIELFGSQAVVALNQIEDYAPGEQLGVSVFNDLEDEGYIVGDVGELKNTDNELRTLKNVGDTTEVFASKSGIFLIARLDSSNDGKYNSWEDFTNKYVDENVKYAGLDLEGIQTFAIDSASKAVLNATDSITEKAEAQSNYQCSAHEVRYQVATWIKPIGRTGGNPGSVPANPRIQFTPQPFGCVSNPDVQDGYVSKGEVAKADCMTSPPNWGNVENVQSTGNYKYKGVYVDEGGGGPWSTGAYKAFPPDPLWTQGNANAHSNHTIYIWFVYEPIEREPDPDVGRIILDLSSTVTGDCSNPGGNAFIGGAAFFRPERTTGNEDRRVTVRLSGAIVYPGGGAYAGANTFRTDPSNFRNLVIPLTGPNAVTNAQTLFPDGQGRNITLWAQTTFDGIQYTERISQFIYPPQPRGCAPPPVFSGTCSIQSVSNRLAGAPGNGVRAGQSVVVTVLLRNTGDAAIPNQYFSASMNNPGSTWTVSPNTGGPFLYNGYGAGAAPGGTKTVSYTITAPNSVSTGTFNIYPDYWGRGPLGPPCPVTIDSYARFDIQPNAEDIEFSNDSERPNEVVFRSSVRNSNPSGVNVPGVDISRVIQKKSLTDSGFSDFRPFGPNTRTVGPNRVPFNDAAPISDRENGDLYCGTVTASPARGWVGPSNRVIADASPSSVSDSTPGCNSEPGDPLEVVDHPYVKIYGGDVESGISFEHNGTCSVPTNVGIFAFMRPLDEHVAGGRSGSGTQLGVHAHGGDILGFASASMRTTAPSSSQGNALTISNVLGATPVRTSIDPLLGKPILGSGKCMPDYFSETQFTSDDRVQRTIAGTRETDKQTIVPTGDFVLNGDSNYDIRHTYYVDGDLTINGRHPIR